MKNILIRNSILVSLIGLIVGFTYGFVPSIAAPQREEQSNKYLIMVDAGESFESVRSAYHKKMNELFNVKIKGLVKRANSTKPEELAKIQTLVTPPDFESAKADEQIKRKPCTDENFSTYCLSGPTTREYFAFREAMLKLRAKERTEGATKFQAATGKDPNQAPDTFFQQKPLISSIFGAEKLQNFGERINRIDDEVEVAHQTLDQALSAYNEMQMALPLHVKYIELISALEKYRNKVSAIRQQIDLYPTTFLNVTTTSCT